MHAFCLLVFLLYVACKTNTTPGQGGCADAPLAGFAPENSFYASADASSDDYPQVKGVFGNFLLADQVLQCDAADAIFNSN